MLLVAGMAGARSARAETVPEISANKVIQLALIDSGENDAGGVERGDRPGRQSCWPPSATITSCGCSTCQAASSFIAGRRTPTGSRPRRSGRTVSILATSGADRRICLWNVMADGKARNVSEPLQAVIYTIAYSPDGRLLAAAGFADKVWVFDAEQGKLLRELPAPGADIRAIGFSPDGTRMAARRTRRAGAHLGCRQRAAALRRAGLLAADLRPGLFARRKDSWRRPASSESFACSIASSGKPVADLPERPGEVMALCFCGPGVAGLGRQRQRDSSLGRGLAAGAIPVGRPYRLDHDAGLRSLRRRR